MGKKTKTKKGVGKESRRTRTYPYEFRLQIVRHDLLTETVDGRYLTAKRFRHRRDKTDFLCFRFFKRIKGRLTISEYQFKLWLFFPSRLDKKSHHKIDLQLL